MFFLLLFRHLLFTFCSSSSLVAAPNFVLFTPSYIFFSLAVSHFVIAIISKLVLYSSFHNLLSFHLITFSFLASPPLTMSSIYITFITSHSFPLSSVCLTLSFSLVLSILPYTRFLIHTPSPCSTPTPVVHHPHRRCSPVYTSSGAND